MSPSRSMRSRAQAGSASGQGQVGITSQSTQPPGPPARLTAALFKVGAFGDNNDGTYVTGDIDLEAITRMNGSRPRVEETEEGGDGSSGREGAGGPPEAVQEDLGHAVGT